MWDQSGFPSVLYVRVQISRMLSGVSGTRSDDSPRCTRLSAS